MPRAQGRPLVSIGHHGDNKVNLKIPQPSKEDKDVGARVNPDETGVGIRLRHPTIVNLVGTLLRYTNDQG